MCGGGALSDDSVNFLFFFSFFLFLAVVVAVVCPYLLLERQSFLPLVIIPAQV